MRRRIPIAPYGAAVVAGAFIVTGFAAVPAGAGTTSASVPSSVSLPITSYYQMAVDSADGRVFISQGQSGGDSIVVTDFSGNIVASIAEPSPVEGIALSPDGSTLYAALVGSTTVSPAISVISTSSLTQRATFPLPAGYTPGDVAVQSGDLWVSYSADVFHGGIGDFDLSATSPTLQTPSVMAQWGTAPMLAADPSGAGHTLVAALPNILSTPVAAYDTSTVTALGEGQPCAASPTEYAYVIDVAVVPGGASLILACDAPEAGATHPYSTSDLSQESSAYATIGVPNAVAIASSTGLVAVGSLNTPQIAEVYTAGGKQTQQYTAVGNLGSLADRGLGLNADGTELFAVTSVWSVANDDFAYSLNVYPDPGITPTSVTLAKPANSVMGKPVTISGTLSIGGAVPGSTSIEMTRTGGGQPPTTFAAAVRSGGFTWVDYPPAGGTYTYTANYAATATTTASSASVTVTVAKATPSLSLTVTPTTAGYGQAVKFNAVVQTLGGPFSTLTVYAQPSGGARTKVSSVTSGGYWNVSGTAHFDRGTTVYAVYSGNAANAAATVTKTVNVAAHVTAAISGYYRSEPGYRLYHRAARVDLSAAVAPVKKGECVQFQVQEYVGKAWRAVATTGCAALNGKSQASGYLTVATYALGVPYRVRADYIRGKDTTNLDADSGFLSFMVER